MKQTRNLFFIVQHIGWWYIAAISIAVFLFSVWKSFDLYVVPCAAPACENLFQLTWKETADLARFGMSPELYGAVVTTLIAIQFVTFFAVGCLLYYYGLKDSVCMFTSMLLIATGTSLGIQPEVFRGYPHMETLLGNVSFAGALYLFFLFLYPNGKFVPRWMALPALVGLTGTVGEYFLEGSVIDPMSWPMPLRTGTFVILHLLIAYTQLHRYRKAATAEQKRQIKWFVASLGSFVIAVPASLVLQSVDHGLAKMATWFIMYTGLLFMPFSIGISIFERRFRSMSLLFNRTIVYMLMSVFVVSIYVIVVGLLGSVLQSSGNVFVSLFATGLAAVLFQPIRRALQLGMNRLVYGEREEPYTVLSRLAQRLESAITHSNLLQSVVEGVAQGLRLPYVAIDIDQDGDRITLASHGNPPGVWSDLPLRIQGEHVGYLRLGIHSWKETLPPEKYHLLDDLVRHAAIAVQAVRLSGELQTSRERLVTAREEERRRLRRDLHDGLGGELAGVALKIDTMLTNRACDDEASGKLGEIQAHLRQSIGNLRRLVYALRPPALDEFGLVYALRDITYHFSDHPLRIHVETPEQMPVLPAAVEVAAYRIVQEAVTNAVRHSKGSRCDVIVRADEQLHIIIQDDGVGLPEHRRNGVGMHSMKERAEELGGRLSVTSSPGKGIAIYATIPILGGFIGAERQHS